jgi:hypothetical protein
MTTLGHNGAPRALSTRGKRKTCTSSGESCRQEERKKMREPSRIGIPENSRKKLFSALLVPQETLVGTSR